MKLSIRGQCALRALIDLANTPPGKVVPIPAIASRQHISKRFLEEILNDLRTGGFVASKRGIHGGYRLAHSPDKIPLEKVLVHLEGSLAILVDSPAIEPCQREAQESQQAISRLTANLEGMLNEFLSQITLAHLSTRCPLPATAPARLDKSN